MGCRLSPRSGGFVALQRLLGVVWSWEVAVEFGYSTATCGNLPAVRTETSNLVKPADITRFVLRLSRPLGGRVDGSISLRVCRLGSTNPLFEVTGYSLQRFEVCVRPQATAFSIHSSVFSIQHSSPPLLIFPSPFLSVSGSAGASPYRAGHRPQASAISPQHSVFSIQYSVFSILHSLLVSLSALWRATIEWTTLRPRMSA